MVIWTSSLNPMMGKIWTKEDLTPVLIAIWRNNLGWIFILSIAMVDVVIFPGFRICGVAVVSQTIWIDTDQLGLRVFRNKKKFYEICVLEPWTRLGGAFYPPPIALAELLCNKCLSRLRALVLPLRLSWVALMSLLRIVSARGGFRHRRRQWA